MGTEPRLHARTEGVVDSLNEAGMTVQIPLRTEFWIDRPNHLRFSMDNTRKGSKELFLNTKTITLYNPDKKTYATIPAKASLRESLEELGKYDVELPFFDIYSYVANPQSITEASVLGKETIDGVDCRLYGFRRQDLEWQVCIQEDMPVPRRLIAIDRTTAKRMRYVSDTYWSKNPPTDDAFYEFTPPKDARLITMKKAPAKVSSASRNTPPH